MKKIIIGLVAVVIVGAAFVQGRNVLASNRTNLVEIEVLKDEEIVRDNNTNTNRPERDNTIERQDRKENRKENKKDNRNFVADNDLNIDEIEITFEEAAKILKDKHSGAIVTSIDLERSRGGWKYEVDGHLQNQEIEIDIDALTGDIIFEDVERDGLENDMDIDFSKLISVEEAIKIAKNNGIVNIDNIKLESERDRFYFEIESDREDIEITLNAINGDILEIDRD